MSELNEANIENTACHLPPLSGSQLDSSPVRYSSRSYYHCCPEVETVSAVIMLIHTPTHREATLPRATQP